jgi:hypothetical protein
VRGFCFAENDIAPDAAPVYGLGLPTRELAMDIHDTAFALYVALVGGHDLANASDETRAAIGREAYRLAEAFIAAKDTYIRELPVSQLDAGF